MRNIYSLFAFIFVASTAFAQIEHVVLPSATHPSTNSPDNPHYAYFDPAPSPLGKLFIFFNGTGGFPAAYRKVVKVAANNGFHAIGLSYPSDISVNMLCNSLPDTTCHRRARAEILTGEDLHPSISVDTNNCIQTRVIKLLQNLHAQHPFEGWDQFYSGDQILWNKTLLGGHSQGGGHACYISKIEEVQRVLMFSWTDIVSPLGRNADYMTWNGPTPLDRYFAFIHDQDEAIPFGAMQLSWDNMGIDVFGPLVNVDSSAAHYWDSHTLFTQATPATDSTKFHGSTVADPYTPQTNGISDFEPVWEYMLGIGAATSVRNGQDRKVVLFPNPAHDRIRLSITEALPFELYNIQGQQLQSGITNGEIALDGLNPGIYLLKLEMDGKIERLKFLKQ